MSCSDVQTIKAGDGSKLTFSFDFPYIFKSEIHVYFWNATTKEYDEKLTTDSTYPWRITDANPTIVEFTGTAPPAPSSPTDPGEPTVDNIKIRRITKVDDIRALFNPGSAIRSDDLNKNFEQLRYAIQESNCTGIPDDVDDYLKTYYWNNFSDTVYSTEAWDSDDDQIATTQAIDARIDSKIDSALTLDIAAADGIVVTDDTPGSGQVTIGIGQGQVDFDRIKAEDVITFAEQNAGSPAAADTNIFTASAAARRFDTLVQTGTPVGSEWQVGKTWLQNDDELTLSIWNGATWTGIASGGTFTNQPKVVYVDASSGSDSNDGHRISRPKLTIKAAIEQINNDATFGDGSVVVVAPGTYQEACPIDIQKSNVSIVGTALRSCIVHPTVATENSVMFRVNSGTFLQNLTFTGMKAGSGTGNSLDADLPTVQGWNVAFFPNCTITKSPYIQNCTNFSDSEIDNSNINVITPGGGAAGDTDNAPTGGGLLVDGSVPAVTSPLRSMVCDSYTHVGLNGPGILVTNNGYAQCTSSYAFFNKYHIKCLNGGQANLAASTTDFGERALIADGKSPNAIFTSNVDGAASSGAISFNINEPAAGVGWFGDTNRPANNMLVTVNSVTYPILSAVANTDSEGGNGWTVTISRPDPNNRSNNLGLNGAVADNLAVEFFLRSQIASSGHTMEYVGSGMDYRALPENGGVPDETKQITELNNGKVWTAVTDHNGKFKIGGNQTDDPIFEVDQQLGFVTIPEGSIAFNLLSDLTPQLGGNLDVNSNTITGLPTTPTSATEATSKAYVDAQIAGIDEVVEDTTPQLGGNLDVNGKKIVSVSNGDIEIEPNGTGNIVLDGDVGVGTSSPSATLHAKSGTTDVVADFESTDASAWIQIRDNSTTDTAVMVGAVGNDMRLRAGSNERVRIDSSGNVGIGTTSPARPLSVSSSQISARFTSSSSDSQIEVVDSSNTVVYGSASGNAIVQTGGSERLRIDTSGRLLIGTTSAPDAGAIKSVQVVNTSTATLSLGRNDSTISAGNDIGAIRFWGNAGGSYQQCAEILAEADGTHANNDKPTRLVFSTTADSGSSPTERMRIAANGDVGIGIAPAAQKLQVHESASSTESYVHITNAVSGGTSADGMLLGMSTSAEGIVWNAENTALLFATNNTERMRIDSSGRVGIGTSNPGNPLHIADQYPTIRLQSNSGSYQGRNTLGQFDNVLYLECDNDNAIANSAMVFTVDAQEAMRIDSSGKVLINTTSPSQYNDRQLTVGDTSLSSSNIEIRSATNGWGGLVFSDSTASDVNSYRGTIEYSHSANQMQFRTDAVERMKIANDGSFRVQGVYNFTIASSANVHVDSGGLIRRVTSSAKYKTNIETIEDSYADALLNCRPVWYQSTCEGDNPDYGWWGFIAEEVAEIDPRLVHWKTTNVTYDEKGYAVETPCDPEAEGVLYDRFVPHLVNLVKRQQEAIKTLETKVAALEAAE